MTGVLEATVRATYAEAVTEAWAANPNTPRRDVACDVAGQLTEYLTEIVDQICKEMR